MSPGGQVLDDGEPRIKWEHIGILGMERTKRNDGVEDEEFRRKDDCGQG